MTYYDDLTRDEKRVSIFKEAIIQNAHGITYDLGTGSGILASFAAPYAKKVYALEINPLVIKKYSDELLSSHENVTLIEADATSYDFDEKADVIICEMLDTALIDEQQLPAINNALNHAKEDTVIIPESTYDTIQVGFSDRSHITYREDETTCFKSYSEEIKYNCVDFSKQTNPHFEKEIKIKVNRTCQVNALLITTYTRVTEDLVTGPTPMLNPPLLIPVSSLEVNKLDTIIVNLKYIMGGGLNTVKANIRRVI